MSDVEGWELPDRGVEPEEYVDGGDEAAADDEQPVEPAAEDVGDDTLVDDERPDPPA